MVPSLLNNKLEIETTGSGRGLTCSHGIFLEKASDRITSLRAGT
jgi:hypothetical protein